MIVQVSHPLSSPELHQSLQTLKRWDVCAKIRSPTCSAQPAAGESPRDFTMWRLEVGALGPHSPALKAQLLA